MLGSGILGVVPDTMGVDRGNGVLGSNPHGNVSSTSVNNVAGIKKPPPWVKTPRRRGGKKTVTAVAVEGNGNRNGTSVVGENRH